MDVFPQGLQMLSRASSDLCEQLVKMISTVQETKDGLKNILVKYEPIVAAANGNLNFKDHKKLIDENEAGSVVKADVQKIIQGDQRG